MSRITTSISLATRSSASSTAHWHIEASVRRPCVSSPQLQAPMLPCLLLRRPSRSRNLKLIQMTHGNEQDGYLMIHSSYLRVSSQEWINHRHEAFGDGSSCRQYI